MTYMRQMLDIELLLVVLCVSLDTTDQSTHEDIIDGIAKFLHSLEK